MEKVALITGASSGIGRATAHEFAKKGYHVAVLARRKDLLDALVEELAAKYSKQKIIAYRCDVRNWNDVMSAATSVLKDFDALEVLVNNAGAFDYCSLEKSVPEKLDEMIDVNVKGVVYVTKAFLPMLKNSRVAGRRAKIVNVSSIAGLWGFPNMSVYTATKFAVTGFSGGIRRELKNLGIQVATIHPGPVRTKPSPNRKEGDLKLLEMLPEQIAKQIVTLSFNSRQTYVSHPAFSFFRALERFSPEVVDRLLKKIL
jgi:NADP-dependent 3-hydroxy acid dehydrogenase YdfG